MSNLSSEVYKQAIRALQSVSEADYKGLVFEFAALCPNEFISVIEKVPSTDRKVMEVFRQTNSIISAIKEYRALTNSGLKDSKDYVEALLEKKGLRNFEVPLHQQ
jgi:ribosomal protein L7/L12